MAKLTVSMLTGKSPEEVLAIVAKATAEAAKPKALKPTINEQYNNIGLFFRVNVSPDKLRQVMEWVKCGDADRFLTEHADAIARIDASVSAYKAGGRKSQDAA